ncbi:MAG: geranylgeranylglycerol-phosphate geranylgeranyltransferase [Candidatus Kariarchaeaceae archaeon]|jgi:geranylgeranylglycerol-phosphate geranylgeranyltransferase
MSKIIPYVKIIRPIDDIVVGLLAIIAVILAGSIPREMAFSTYLLIAIGGFLLSAHAMVVNDIIDLEIDLINEPKRMIPSGRISKTQAKLYSIVLGMGGIAFAVLVDQTNDIHHKYSWLWAISHLILADLYNFKLKKTGFIGNIMVAYTSLSIFIYGDFFFNGHFTLLSSTFGAIAFLGNLSREILKGIMDVEGDAQYSVQTIAVRFSPTIARNISFSLLIISMSLTGIIFNRLLLVGKLGIFVFLGNFTFALNFVSKATRPGMARKGKHMILLGPLLLIPFLLIDRIIAS